MSDTSLYFNFLKGRDTASPAMRDVGNAATSMASKLKLSSILSVAATGAMYLGFAALGAEAVALVAALGPLIGLLALLPALGVAAAAGFGVLLVATHGISAAMKQTAESGAAAAQAQVAAERRLVAAQQTSLDAQKALNDAREQAADKLRDVNLQLARSRLDERAAILGVADAQKALQAAQRSGNRDAIQHAALSYAEAAQSLQEVQARLQDVTEENTKRNAQGVEGSDEVQQALRRQADAMQSLADAQKAVTTAGAGNAAQKAYAQLSSAGKELVDSLRSIGPAWHSVQTAVQQATFAGVGADIKALANTWFPVLKVRLSEIGAGWNTAFRGVLHLATSKGFVDDFNVSLGNMAAFWQKVGQSFTPFLDGFRQFTVTGSAFLPGIGDWVLRIANQFDHWATAARESGKAQKWIADGLKVLSQTWEILKNLGASVVALFHAGSGGPDWLQGLVDGTGKLRAWMESPAAQGKMAAVFATLRDVGGAMADAIGRIGPALLDAFTTNGDQITSALDDLSAALDFAAGHLDDIAKALPALAIGYAAYKTSVIGATVVEAIRLPITAASAVANFRLASAMNASTEATRAATASQAAFDVALDANPIGLFIIAIALMGAEIYYMVTHFKVAIENFKATWEKLDFLKPFRDNWDGFVGFWGSVIDFLKDVGPKIANAAHGMWDGIKDSFKAVINWIISKWNGLHFGVPKVDMGPLGSYGGQTFEVPQIPMLAAGGTAMAAGMAIVGDKGPELAYMPKGATIAPLSTGGAREVKVRIELGGAEELKKVIRKIVHDDGGGDVQVAFGI